MNRDYTPLANRTTVSSRNKMAVPATAGQSRLHQIANRVTSENIRYGHPSTVSSKIPPRTVIKPPVTKVERPGTNYPATSSRIAVPKSRLSDTNDANSPKSISSKRLSKIAAATTNGIHGRLTSGMPPPTTNSTKGVTNNHTNISSFANSRSSSKVSTISSITNNNLSRQSSLSNAQMSLKKGHSSAGAASSYIPDTNSVRKGLAKFSNPIECQRQFQALNSNIRNLYEIKENNERQIAQLQEQLNGALDRGVGYATIVQYFSHKLKIDSGLDLVSECEQLKKALVTLKDNEEHHQERLDSMLSTFKEQLDQEVELRSRMKSEYEEAQLNKALELQQIKDEHCNELRTFKDEYQNIKSELDNRIETLEKDLRVRTSELNELRKEYDILNNNFNKLEESLTKDKDARVKYAQEKVNQLQKDVDSLNSVLEMKTERIHTLERDSILLTEVQQELTKSQDQNKALKQQLESLNAALENRRIQLEKLLVDHEELTQELKRERKERRRMTMRSEHLEFVLNESATDNNGTVIDHSLGS